MLSSWLRGTGKVLPARHYSEFLRLAQCLAAALVLSGCESADHETLPPRPVKAMRVESVQSLDNIGFNATVIGRRETPLAFQVAGKILSRKVNPGDRVTAQQTLLKMDPADFELRVTVLEAELQVASAEQQTAKADLERFQELRKKKFVSPTDLDRSRNRFSASSGQINALGAQLKLAQRQLEYTNLRAEFAGWISELEVDVGQVVAAGQTMGRLASQQLEVTFELPEQYSAELNFGDNLPVTFWSCQTCATSAEVREIGGAANVSTRSLSVKATLAETGKQLRPGMTAWVEMPMKLPGNAVLVPELAIIEMEGAPAVWVVDENSHTTHRRKVILGPNLKDQVLVTEGLATGEWVVTAGMHTLAEQQSVRVLD